ncbi:5-amino-6-(D-ribitylamino)uracil--L-tyrosine 4-hydroxyphenyl transferase CofH [Methanocella sp. MCL-LM]|uniref:5-amino-6-(D-ribitylamino)uracil--L-tyrosine 4-hydroxyphenyl transferase CofH n=1 Tax=Methanocella sp. MCL-LM TaxID=3412035 RepID=UPI003C78936E
MLKDIYERSLAGEITIEDARKLLDANPFELFDTADRLRKEIIGDTVTYVVNRNINFTDFCVGTCKFCSFRNSKGFRLTLDEILQKVGEAKQMGSTEVCIQGGLTEDMYLEDYAGMIRAIKNKYDIHTHAFSPMEVYHMSRMSGVTVEESLKTLKAAGLNSMPGTAAEILDDEIRSVICPGKLSTQEWVDVVSTAHRVGIPTTATIMYGHIETWEHRLKHLFIVRDVQRKTHGITEFVPLTFMHENNPLSGQSTGASGMDDLRMYALARVIFGRDIPNVQASWVKLGMKLAQVALNCGANDVGGTLMEENISKSAGSKSGEYMSPDALRGMIKAAERSPKQRNTLYKLLD